MNFSKIKSIKKAGHDKVYHLTVKNNHNFFANKICVHNCGYRGEGKVILFNTTDLPVYFAKGSRIAQFVVKPVEQAMFVQTEELSDSDRGAGGFGSTGV